MSMTLRDYLNQRGRGEISRIVRESGCAASTIHDVLNGKPIARYDTAKRISDATDGAVSIADLCSAPDPDAADTAEMPPLPPEVHIIAHTAAAVDAAALDLDARETPSRPVDVAALVEIATAIVAKAG